jgi:glutathione-regulated potassium-efflux system ancillary protein KefF
MKNIVLLSGHPDISRSTANRIFIEELDSDKKIITSDIKMNYPDDKIDVEKEQQQSISANLVILQSPFLYSGKKR